MTIINGQQASSKDELKILQRLNATSLTSEDPTKIVSESTKFPQDLSSLPDVPSFNHTEKRHKRGFDLNYVASLLAMDYMKYKSEEDQPNTKVNVKIDRNNGEVYKLGRK